MTYKQTGASIIEILFVIAIIMVSFWSLLELAQYNLRIQEISRARIEANFLTSEAIEAIRFVRNESWDNISFLSPAIKYYPVITDNKWTLATDDPGLINGRYSQYIIVQTVARDDNDDIGSGTTDENTRSITAFTEWREKEEIKQIQISTYLTNWR